MISIEINIHLAREKAIPAKLWIEKKHDGAFASMSDNYYQVFCATLLILSVDARETRFVSIPVDTWNKIKTIGLYSHV